MLTLRKDSPPYWILSQEWRWRYWPYFISPNMLNFYDNDQLPCASISNLEYHSFTHSEICWTTTCFKILSYSNFYSPLPSSLRYGNQWSAKPRSTEHIWKHGSAFHLWQILVNMKVMMMRVILMTLVRKLPETYKYQDFLVNIDKF